MGSKAEDVNVDGIHEGPPFMCLSANQHNSLVRRSCVGVAWRGRNRTSKALPRSRRSIGCARAGAPTTLSPTHRKLNFLLEALINMKVRLTSGS